MTREHVFGQWLSRIGLDLSPVPHRAGPLNRIPRDMGEQPPFRLTVKNVCSDCNNGWMSQLEDIAQRVLTPLILGRPGTIEAIDHAAIATWVQKTALVAMLLSSDEQRSNGYGFAPSTYRALYEIRDRKEPLDATQTWVGHYQGAPNNWAVRVTPICICIAGTPEPELPQGYISTIALGQLILQDLRFINSALGIEMNSAVEMPKLWPSRAPVEWPNGQPCGEDGFQGFADGDRLESTVDHVTLRPWTHASQLAQSTIDNGSVKLPALCGHHSIRYPGALLREALAGGRYAFVSACECPTAYLIYMETDSAHFRAAGEWTGISQMYEDLAGEELLIEDDLGFFICKRLPAAEPAG